MRPALAAPLAGGAAAGLLGASVLLGDGSSDGPVAWIGIVAALVAGAGATAALLGLLPVPELSRWALAFFVLLTAFIAWNGISVLWSSEPDRTWDYFNRGLVYLLLAVVGVFAGSYVRRAVLLTAGVLSAVLAFAVGWALLVKAVPRLDADSGRIARLHQPIGYWNALALLIDMALPLALWLAARREHPPWLRAAGTVFLYASIAALLLTYSRGGIAVGVVALAAWFVLGGPRVESAAALALAGPAGVGVAVWAFSKPGLADDHQPYSARFHDGIWFAVVVVVVGAVVTALAHFLARLEVRRPLSPVQRQAAGRLGVAALVVVVLAGGALAIQRGAGPSRLLRDFSQSASPTEASGPRRIITLTSNSRSTWWREAWHAFKAHPANGTGAGSFELTDRRLRPNRIAGKEPHDLPLQFLSETGVFGFLLAVGAAVAGFGALVRRRTVEDAAAGALAIGPIVYLLHSLVDFDWDFIAVSGPLFLVLGVLVSGHARAREPQMRPLLWAPGAAVLGLAVVYSLLAPWLAAQKVDDGYAALQNGAARAAAGDASEAHDLNPLALEPLFAWAAAEAVRGDPAAARRLYIRAVRLQPLNSRSWLELGRFELAEGNRGAAATYLDRAATLDPQGPAAALRAQAKG